jgi:hypothetical protein
MKDLSTPRGVRYIVGITLRVMFPGTAAKRWSAEREDYDALSPSVRRYLKLAKRLILRPASSQP